MTLNLSCPRNIVLIGMPGAGKSTVGVLLAKRLGYAFVDTDLLIQSRQGQRLQEMIQREGLNAFKRVEEDVLCGLASHRTVIATGGSAIYSERAMDWLRKTGVVVFINVPLDILSARIKDMDSRGVVIGPDESFDQLFRQRLPLYRNHADLVIEAGALTAEAVSRTIEETVCNQV